MFKNNVLNKYDCVFMNITLFSEVWSSLFVLRFSSSVCIYFEYDVGGLAVLINFGFSYSFLVLFKIALG